MALTHLNNDNFQASVDAAPLAVVDFWATWCGPCKMIAPAMESLATKYEGRVLVAKVDVDVAGETAQKFGVMSIPTIVVLRNGKEVDRIVGVVPESALSDVINLYV